MTYSQLLPGITNVTERARYFSFYTWVSWSFDNHLKNLGADRYVEYFRKADCLYTLIAAHDALDLGRQRPAERMVGRLKLSPALGRLKDEGSLRLSEFSTQEDNGSRYFQNEMGGLGQYYTGPLTELGLCKRAASGPWVQYSKSLGASLAEAVEETLPSKSFWQAVEQDVINSVTLNNLHEFAPRRIVIGSSEHERLLDIMLERSPVLAEGNGDVSSAERRKTLGLILHLAQKTDDLDGESLHEWSFRPSVYAGALPGGATWEVPKLFRETKALWALYERNDLLSSACQTIFSASLLTLETEAGLGRFYESVEVFAVKYTATPEVLEKLDALRAETFGALVERIKQSGPPISNFEDSQHEFQLEMNLHDSWGRTEDSPESFVTGALMLIATLASRAELFPDGYGNVAIAATNLGAYPINLASFQSRTLKWKSMRLPAALNDMIVWILNTHLSVALRKLAQTRTSSFHLQPTEYGLQVLNGIPGPARTLPRITQAIRILEDLGALQEVGDDYLIKLSPLGGQLLEDIVA